MKNRFKTNPIESLSTRELAEKAGVTMFDVRKHNMSREDLIAMVTEGSYAKGGGVGEGFKLYLKSWDADVHEDDYEQGEGEHVNYFGEKENKSFDSAEKLFDYINNNVIYKDLDKGDFSVMEDGRVITSLLVDEDNSPASESEIEEWKKGNKKLYSASYNLYINLIDERTPSSEELSKILGIGIYSKGGGLKQKSAQYGHKNYGVGDRQKHAKPVGYRYRKIRDPKTGKIRVVTKDDHQYYKSPSMKMIRDYEQGDKTARKMLYFEDRVDHSDKAPLRSLSKYAKGGSVTIDGKKAKYQVKYNLDGKEKIGYIVPIMTPSGNAVDIYYLYDKNKKLVKELRVAEANQLVKDKKIINVKTYDVPMERLETDKEKSVKDMDYSERRNWIQDHIIPHLKSASLSWRDYQGGWYDYNDSKEEEKFLKDARTNADYKNEKDFNENSGFKIAEDGWGISTKEGEDLEEVSSDNTYNWSYLGLVTWNIRIYQAGEEKFFLIAHPHKGGDVRGNYGDPIIFEDDSEESVMYKFREQVIDGNRVVSLEFKGGVNFTFDAEQDSDVDYFKLNDEPEKLKIGSPAELTLSTWKTFGGWHGDEFLTTIVDEFEREHPKKKKKEFGGEYSKGGRLVIKNIDNGKYVETEEKGKVTYTSKIKDALSFTKGDEDSEADAESTLEFLNSVHEEGFSLIDISKKECGGDVEMKRGGDVGSLQSLTTGQLATKAGMTMKEVHKFGYDRDDLIAMITEGNYRNGGGVGEKVDGKTKDEWKNYIRANRKKFPIVKLGEDSLTEDLDLNNDTTIELTLDLGDKLNFLDEEGEWKSDAHREFAYSLVDSAPMYEVEGQFSNGGGVGKDAGLLTEKEKFELNVLKGLSGFNYGQSLNGLLESMGLSNYRFSQNASEREVSKVKKSLSSLIKKGYVNEGGLGYEMTHEGAVYLRSFDYGTYANGGGLKQKREQYTADDRGIEKYGRRDNTVKARPIGYRYRKIRDKQTGRLRRVEKDDAAYYKTPSQSDIKAYNKGDKDARRRMYFEARKDHSDKNPRSNRGFRRGGDMNE